MSRIESGPGRAFRSILAAGLCTAAAASCISEDPAPETAGARFYVSPEGDDSASGDVSTPWRDIGGAVGRLRPGDTLFVRDGVYPGGIEVPVSGEPGRPITISAYPGERPEIDANHVYGFLLGCGIHDVAIRGFEIHNFSERYAGGFEVHRMAHAAGIMGRCDDLTRTAVSDSAFLDNVIHNGDGAGADGGPTGEGIWLRLSPRNLVAGNVIHSLGSSGIRLKHSEGCTVFSNLVFKVGLTDGLGGGITFYCAPDTEVSFNTVVMANAPDAPAILVYDGTSPEECVASDRSKVHHNIGVRLGENGREVLSDALCVQRKNTTASDLEIRDNLWWAAGRLAALPSAPACPAAGDRPAVVLWGGSIVYEHGCWLPVPDYQRLSGQGAGDTQADPGFVDAAGRDFRLRSGSPAVAVAAPGPREIGMMRLIGLEVPASARIDLGFQFPSSTP